MEKGDLIMSEEVKDVEKVENNCNCTKKLLVAATVSNAIATLLLTITFIVLVFGLVLPQAGGFELPKFKSSDSQQLEHKFKGKTVSYEDAMQDKKYAAVLFYADWCPHCRRFSPIFEKLSKNRKLNKKFNFVRINAESQEAPALMEEYKVNAFPSLFLVNPKDGEAYFISNSLFSNEDAVDILKDLFKTYSDSRDKKAAQE